MQQRRLVDAFLSRKWGSVRLGARLRADPLPVTRFSTRLGLIAILAVLAACSRKRIPQIELDQTRPAADWLKVPEVRMLHDYIRLDTRASQGEQAGAEYLQRLLDCEGIESEIVCPAPRRCNVIARLPGRRREGALLLLNHIDVAPVDPATWR